MAEDELQAAVTVLQYAGTDLPKMANPCEARPNLTMVQPSMITKLPKMLIQRAAVEFQSSISTLLVQSVKLQPSDAWSEK